MSERKIIINDIDIGDCKFWKGYCRIGSLCDYAGHICEVKSDCYFKQNAHKQKIIESVSEYIKDNCNSCQGIKYGGCDKCELKRIKEIISKAKDCE